MITINYIHALDELEVTLLSTVVTHCYGYLMRVLTLKPSSKCLFVFLYIVHSFLHLAYSHLYVRVRLFGVASCVP